MGPAAATRLITVYVITVQTPGLLSRGSQVRILPGAPVLARTRDSSLLHRLTREHFAGLKRPVGLRY